MSSALLVLPVVLKELSSDDFAVWSIFLVFYSMLVLLDFGLKYFLMVDKIEKSESKRERKDC